MWSVSYHRKVGDWFFPVSFSPLPQRSALVTAVTGGSDCRQKRRKYGNASRSYIVSIVPLPVIFAEVVSDFSDSFVFVFA
jgi:hypothetical protein